MEYASGPAGNFPAVQPPSTCEGTSLPTGIAKDAAGADDEGAPPSEGESSALDREGLLCKLQRTVSFSLSRISSIVPASVASMRRKSSVGADAVSAVAEGVQEGCDAEVGSPALKALMPFVPLMFRRDLLLPEPTFSALQVVCCAPSVCSDRQCTPHSERSEPEMHFPALLQTQSSLVSSGSDPCASAARRYAEMSVLHTGISALDPSAKYPA